MEDFWYPYPRSLIPSHLVNLVLKSSVGFFRLNSAYIQRDFSCKSVIDEYFSQGHAELVPVEDLDKPGFYMPVHSVTKDSNTTTKIRVVFDASMKTSSGISLNDTLCTGPTVHSSLLDGIM